MDPGVILIDAARAWNAGDFYEAHERLEDLADLLEDDDQDHRVALGLVQAAACLHKWVERVSPQAVPGKLERALRALAPGGERWRGLELGALRRGLAAWGQALPDHPPGTPGAVPPLTLAPGSGGKQT